LFQSLDDTSKQLKAMKVRRETSASPVVDFESFMDRKQGMAEQHPRCEELFREGEALRKGGSYQKAIGAYEQSKRAYMHDIGSKSLETVDKLHLSVRDDLIAQCYVHMSDYKKALQPALNSTTEYPTAPTLMRLADIYDHLKMPKESAKARSWSGDVPSTPEAKEYLLNAIR
jgi:tetratricopeptide (TPR) repeat protein